MAFEQIGVSTVIEGLSSFRSGADQFNRSVQSMGDTAKNLASSSLSPVTSALGVFGSAIGNIGQIVTGILTAGLFRDIANGIADVTRQAFEAAASFQTLQIQIQGLIALQIADQFAANNMVSQSFETLITLTGEETSKLQELTLESSDLHSKMELLERKIPKLIEQFGASSAEVNLAQNQLTRYGIALSETDAQIAALNEKNGAYVTVTKLVQGATLDMATAQAQAEGPAKELLQWIEDFGIKTPFTIQQLSEMVRGFLSIGMGIEPTKQLTNALASLGAGLGLTQAQLDRIVQNILQTSRSAKITERDIREFGNAGVPVNRVLDKMAAKLGITREAALEFAKSGVEGTKAFTDALIEVGEKDFPDALDNLSKTWAVAASNIQDVIQSIFGKEVLGPLLARLGIFIGDAVDDLISMREVFRGIGETVGVAFDSILPSVLNLADSVGGLVVSLFKLAGIDLSQFNVNTAIETAAGAIKGFIDKLTEISNWFQSEIIPKAEIVKQWFIDNWPKATAALQPLIDGFGNLNSAIVDSWPVIRTTLELMGKEISSVFSTVSPEVISNLGGSLDQIAIFWDRHKTTVLSVVLTLWQAIVLTVGGALTLLSGLIESSLILINGVFEGFSQLLQGNWAAMNTAMVLAVANSTLNILQAFDVFFDSVLGLMGTNLTAFRAQWQYNWDTFYAIVVVAIGRTADGIAIGIIKIINTAIGGINTLVGQLFGFVDQFTKIGQAWIDGIVNGIMQKIGYLQDSVINSIKETMDKARQTLGIASPSKVTAELIGQPFGEGIAQGILNSIGSIQSAMSVAVQPPVAAPAMAFASGTVINQTNTVNADVRDGVDIELLALRVAGVMQGGLANG